MLEIDTGQSVKLGHIDLLKLQLVLCVDSAHLVQLLIQLVLLLLQGGHRGKVLLVNLVLLPQTFLLGLLDTAVSLSLIFEDLLFKSLLPLRIGLHTLLALSALALVGVLGSLGGFLQAFDVDLQLLFLNLVGHNFLLRRGQPVVDELAETLPALVELAHIRLVVEPELAAELLQLVTVLRLGELSDKDLRALLKDLLCLVHLFGLSRDCAIFANSFSLGS